ncbi:transposase family protein [Kitasatospora sp. MAP12-22]|uniref:transposase family protein n=1 Tax=unclassified Kitasatospora TaxID=2633591 RepID=UPI003518B30E
MPDLRRAKGRRHPLAFVLALAACAVLASAKSLTAIAEWAADAPPAVLTALGVPSREPSGPNARPRPPRVGAAGHRRQRHRCSNRLLARRP